MKFGRRRWFLGVVIFKGLAVYTAALEFDHFTIPPTAHSLDLRIDCFQYCAATYYLITKPMSLHSPHREDQFFMSLPPRMSRRGPDGEVPILVEQAKKIKSLNPALRQFMIHNKRAFLDLFSRQIRLIKSRSQAFEDGQVTVFDKALLILTRNGTDLDDPAAIQFFCEESLGIEDFGDVADTNRTLQQATRIPRILEQGKQRCPICGLSF